MDNNFLGKDFYTTVEIKGHLKKVLYSDSVAGYTETVIKRKNQTGCCVITFEKLWDELISYGNQISYQNNKEYIFLKDDSIKTLTYDVKTDQIIIDIPQYVMRHNVDTKLVCMKISNCFSLDVTNNHSLLKYNKKTRRFDIIKPKECSYLPSLDNQCKFNCSINIDWFLLGLFFGDGSYSSYYPALSSGYRKEIILFIKQYIPDLIIYDKTNDYDYYINYKPLTLMLENNNLQKKKSPDRLLSNDLFNNLNDNPNKLLNFLCGYYLADGTFNCGMIVYSSSNYQLLYQIKVLCINIGINSIISIVRNNRKYKNVRKGDMYKLKLLTTNMNIINMFNLITPYKDSPKIERKSTWFGKGTSSLNNYVTRKYSNAHIKNVKALHTSNEHEIEYSGYVYDLCVPKTQTFVANGVVLHNTDSIFVTIPTKEDARTLPPDVLWNKAIKASNGINDLIVDYTKNILLPRCNIKPEHNETFFKTELLMEAIMFLDTKKRYAYKLLIKEGNPLNPPKVDYTGIDVIKSNVAKLTQDLLREIIENIALNSDILKNEKRTVLINTLNEFHKKFLNCVENLDTDYIGIPGKWAKVKNIISGMKLYNHIMNESVFEPTSSAKFVYINPVTIGEFKNVNGICLPYEFNTELVKEKFEIFKINIDKKTHWSKLYNKTCERVVDVIKS